MVLVPAGEFRMGSPEGEGEADEHPQHSVALNAFYIHQYEVTVADYDKFAQATGRQLPDDEGWGRGQRPVINVSGSMTALGASIVLPPLAAMYQQAGVELRGCPATRAIVPGVAAAAAEDWDTEYLAPILSIRVLEDMDEAIDHIQTHGSAHTDAIVTEDLARARRFLREVDSSSVMVNASTRFADGFEYGLGAEIGISTDKLHARGPVGLEGLTSQKFVVLGDGHIRK